MLKRPARVNLIAAACLAAPQHNNSRLIFHYAQGGPIRLIRLRKVTGDHIDRIFIVVVRWLRHLAMPLLEENTHFLRDVPVFSRGDQLLWIMGFVTLIGSLLANEKPSDDEG